MVVTDFYARFYFNNDSIESVSTVIGIVQAYNLSQDDFYAVVQQLYAEWRGWA